MSPESPSRSRQRLLPALGALFASAAVALSAYAAHAATPDARVPLQSAAAIAFGHGLALAALAPQSSGRLAQVALWGMALGTLLFSGGIALHHLARIEIGVAPVGGSLLILAWLLWGAAALRR